MSSKAFVRQIFQFLYQVNESRTLLPVDVRVAIQLTRHFNEREDGRGRAGLEYIGKAIGAGKATVHRSVHRLHREGHLRVQWGSKGSGNPTQYWMAVRDQRSTQVNLERSTQVNLEDDAQGPSENIQGPSDASQRSIAMEMNHLRTTIEPLREAASPEIETNNEGKKGRGNSRKKPLTDFPKDWKPNAASTAHGEGLGLSAREIENARVRFKGWHIAKGSVFADWHQAFRNWCDKQAEILGRKPRDETAANGAAVEFLMMPESLQFQAWRMHYQDANNRGMVRQLEQRALEGRPWPFESEWPPRPPSPSRAVEG